MSDQGKDSNRFNGLTRELVNFPKQLVELKHDYVFADEEDVEELTPEQCRHFMDTICGIGNLLVQKGAVKYKLTDPNVAGSDWLKEYKSLVNGGKRYEKKKPADVSCDSKSSAALKGKSELAAEVSCATNPSTVTPNDTIQVPAPVLTVENESEGTSASLEPERAPNVVVPVSAPVLTIGNESEGSSASLEPERAPNVVVPVPAPVLTVGNESEKIKAPMEPETSPDVVVPVPAPIAVLGSESEKISAPMEPVTSPNVVVPVPSLVAGIGSESEGTSAEMELGTLVNVVFPAPALVAAAGDGSIPSPNVVTKDQETGNERILPTNSVRISARVAALKRKSSCLDIPKSPAQKKMREVPKAKAVAELKAQFILLKEIRNLGRNLLSFTHYDENEAVKILPQLRGITISQLETFYGELFGEVDPSNVESQRMFVKRYFQVLRSLPPDPAGTIKGSNSEACGLLIPYVHSFDNAQINNDEEITGLHMDQIEGALLNYNAKKSKTKGLVGRVPGINNSMMFYGVAGSTFPDHLECGNAYGSINYMPDGDLKFWKIVESKYCAEVRRNLMDVMKKLVADGLDSDLKKQSDQICLLQHKRIIILPEFLDECKPRPIPYKIFLQRKNELMVVGTAVHHGGATGGCHGTIARATNIIPPDYHLAMPINFVQCDGHGIPGNRRFVLSDDDIEHFRQEAIKLYNRGVKKEKHRAILAAIEEYRRIQWDVHGSMDTTGLDLSLLAIDNGPGTSPVKTSKDDKSASVAGVEHPEDLQGTSSSSKTNVAPLTATASCQTDVEVVASTSSNVDDSKPPKAPKEVKWHRGAVRTAGKLSPAITCPKCHREFNQWRDQKYHVERDSCNDEKTCEKCGKKYKFHQWLLKHMKTCKDTGKE